MAPPLWQVLNCSFCLPSAISLPILCLPLQPSYSYFLLGGFASCPAYTQFTNQQMFSVEKTVLNVGITYAGSWPLNACLL